ncbi:hypothetical protein V6Z12_D10G153600 [Gossypium hirsutum]
MNHKVIPTAVASENFPFFKNPALNPSPLSILHSNRLLHLPPLSCSCNSLLILVIHCFIFSLSLSVWFEKIHRRCDVLLEINCLEVLYHVKDTLMIQQLNLYVIHKSPLR